MPLAKRLIARLDIKGKKLIKGIRFEGLKVIGDALEIAEKYYLQGIDEILYIDAVASLYGRNSLSEILSENSKRIFVPITAGGGIKSVIDAKALISNGADKVAINTGLLEDLKLANKLVKVFGGQCVVASIQAKKSETLGWEVMKSSGRERTGKSVVDWIEFLQKQGVGEILLTSVDMDGLCKGVDNDLIETCEKVCRIPLIVGGGFSTEQEIQEKIINPNISAVAIGASLHKNKLQINKIKSNLQKKHKNLFRAIDIDEKEKLKNIFNKDTDRSKVKNIVIIDYGLGNNLSLYNALEKLNYNVIISSSLNEISKSPLVFLPGVGSFSEGIKNLRKEKLDKFLIERAKRGDPIIGICLGMQMLFDKGFEDGINNGLGLIPGEVNNMSQICGKENIILPHVGWNFIKGNDMFSCNNYGDQIMQYFVHSFNAYKVPEKYKLHTFEYCQFNWIASVKKDNIIGFQFHPERSGKQGLKLLDNFIKVLLK